MAKKIRRWNQRRILQTSNSHVLGVLIAVYFSELLIDVNLVFRLVPRPLTTAMIASAMPAAIRPYSIAVAPLSSLRNRYMSCMVVFPDMQFSRARALVV